VFNAELDASAWSLAFGKRVHTALGRPRIAVAIMSKLTYAYDVSPKHKPLVWLQGEVKTPPFSSEARIEAGYLLRQLQAGQFIGMPRSRPMPSIGARCHELRIQDTERTWRLMYRIDGDAIVIAEVFRRQRARRRQV
jgi:phage-related protein